MCVCTRVCMYNFVHMCAGACMCIAMCVCVSVICVHIHSTRQPWVSFIRSHEPFFFLLGRVSPDVPGWQANKPQRSTYPCFSTSEVTGVHCCAWHFHRHPGNHTQVLLLPKHGWAISPLPSVPLPSASVLFSHPLHYDALAHIMCCFFAGIPCEIEKIQEERRESTKRKEEWEGLYNFDLNYTDSSKKSFSEVVLFFLRLQ